MLLQSKQMDLLRKPSQKARILKLFETKGAVSNVELNHEVGFRYSSRIHELRQEGHIIDTGMTDNFGKVIYYYRGNGRKI